MNGYNDGKSGGKAEDVREKGSVDKKAPVYKEGPNPNADVPKLPQIKGVAQD